MIRQLSLLFLVLCGSVGQALGQGVSVGPQYDTTHVYVAPDDFNRFVKSLSATFGGTTSPEGEFQVTPTPSKTMSQLVLTPVGTISVFGFKNSNSLSLRGRAHGIPCDRHGRRYRLGQGSRRRRAGGSVQRPGRPRRRDPMGGRRQHAALLAHHQAELRRPDDRPREPPLRLARAR